MNLGRKPIDYSVSDGWMVPFPYFYYSLLRCLPILYSKLQIRHHMEPNSSIPSIPPLPFAAIENRPPPKLQNELKQRMASRLTLTDILELPPISEETTDRLSTDRSTISITHMRTLRAMRINALREMSEEECLVRYAKDPFFRKKVHSEVRSLGRATSYAHLAHYDHHDPSPAQIQRTIKLIEQERDVTFRKVMESECEEIMASKNKLEQVIGQLRLKVEDIKEND